MSLISQALSGVPTTFSAWRHAWEYWVPLLSTVSTVHSFPRLAGIWSLLHHKSCLFTLLPTYINFHRFLSQYYFFITFLLFTAKLLWEGIKIWSPFFLFIFCHFQHLRSPVGHHFSKSNTFLFSFLLTSQEQIVDMFIYTFLLERFSSPELQDIIFSRLSSHFSKPLCLLPWLLFCSTCRCWRTPRFCSAT